MWLQKSVRIRNGLHPAWISGNDHLLTTRRPRNRFSKQNSRLFSARGRPLCLLMLRWLCWCFLVTVCLCVEKHTSSPRSRIGFKYFLMKITMWSWRALQGFLKHFSLYVSDFISNFKGRSRWSLTSLLFSQSSTLRRYIVTSTRQHRGNVNFFPRDLTGWLCMNETDTIWKIIQFRFFCEFQKHFCVCQRRFLFRADKREWEWWWRWLFFGFWSPCVCVWSGRVFWDAKSARRRRKTADAKPSDQ